MRSPVEKICLKENTIVLIVILGFAFFGQINRTTPRTISAAQSDETLENLIAKGLFLLESKIDLMPVGMRLGSHGLIMLLN